MAYYTFCVKSLQQKKIQVEEECPVEIGEALERIYPVMKLILQYLSYKDLKSAMLVNDVWKARGAEELRKRNGASWVSLHGFKTPLLTIECSNNFQYDDMAFGFIFYNSRDVKLNRYLCIHDEPIRRITFLEYLDKEIMTNDTKFWAFSCPLVYSPTLSKNPKCLFCGVFIPEIPNIHLKKFIVSCEKVNSAFEKNISNEYIHCVLLFTLSDPNLIIQKFAKELFQRNIDVDKLAIGGGVISNGIKPFERNSGEKLFKSNTLFCMAFTQNMDTSAEFDSYSIVIPEYKDFESELIELKKRIQMRKHSFAFRICCAAKERNDIETVLFNKVFPEVFMIGFDADGEIGWNNIDITEAEEDELQPKKPKLETSLCHQYTTIIVVLTWGKKIQQTA